MQLSSISLAITRLVGGLSAPPVFTPASIFTPGVNGFWHDPSDYSTLFQDAAGTTPVTAVEQPVGLMLDKSKGLVLGPELVTNGDFIGGSTGWLIGGGWTITGGEAVASGTSNFLYQTPSAIKAYRYYECKVVVSNYTSGSLQIYVGGAPATYSSNITSNGAYVFRMFTSTSSQLGVKGNAFAGTVDNISVKELTGNHAFQSTSANRPTLSARYNLLAGTESLGNQTVTTQATSYRLTFSGTGTIALSGSSVLAAVTAGTYTFSAAAGSLVVTVVGSVTQADIRATNDSLGQSAYQRVNTSTDYDTVGFKPYLRFNGTSSSMQTNSIDFTATDKMFVCAGVRKLSDAATGVIVENGPWYTPGTPGFSVVASANYTPINNYEFGLAGTSLIAKADLNYIAPITNLLSIYYDIAGTTKDQEIASKINGVTPSNVAWYLTSAGTGYFGNQPIYIGARVGSSRFFNGRLHQLVIAGKQASASEITNTETFINQKTGAY